ncbi:hypothetical protein AU190_19050 [Mycolicibacterium acapulense]|nr:hypothetical protein AU189_15220 [Mycolicibacterium acapulense]KUI06798.1 hypothetical protein AU191_23940 [Mycolicibacterium acapulense]KUI10588.1 hypothetical protein AU190_19050 [Mycolicibacterium acapulense]
MAAIDPARSYRALEKRLAEITDQRHRVVLGAVTEHARLESGADWDVDALMATLVADPAYYIWVNGIDVGPKGADAVRAYYCEFVRTQTNFMESIIDRVVVDDRCAVIEGFAKQIYPGVEAARMGMSVYDPNADYLLEFRTLTVMPVDQNGQIEGEDVYVSGPASATKLAQGDLPAEYARLRQAQRG